MFMNDVHYTLCRRYHSGTSGERWYQAGCRTFRQLSPHFVRFIVLLGLGWYEVQHSTGSTYMRSCMEHGYHLHRHSFQAEI